MPAKRQSKQGKQTSKSSAHKKRRTETTDADSEDGRTSKQRIFFFSVENKMNSYFFLVLAFAGVIINQCYIATYKHAK